jgi:hypothetical protein
MRPSGRGERHRLGNALRVIVRRLTNPRAIVMRRNDVHVGHLHKLIAGASRRGMTASEGLSVFHQQTMGMHIANLMVARRAAGYAETEMYVHRVLVLSGLEHDYLEMVWGKDRSEGTAARR